MCPVLLVGLGRKAHVRVKCGQFLQWVGLGWVQIITLFDYLYFFLTNNECIGYAYINNLNLWKHVSLLLT